MNRTAPHPLPAPYDPFTTLSAAERTQAWEGTGGQPPARHFLRPGELFMAEESAMVATLLGSCVAVTMYAPRRRLGAVCHSMLPVCRHDKPCGGDCPEGSRYVNCSIRRMLAWFQARGILRHEIEVKLFGGSEMLHGHHPEREWKGIGRQNIDMALQVLEADGLLPVASDLGGMRGRKIFFNTDTGEVFLQRLRHSQPQRP